ncbi:MAG: hypothetical protein ACLUD0_04540 [Eubacterium ramulus]
MRASAAAVVVDFFDATDGGSQRAAVVVAVEGIQKAPSSPTRATFGGGGTCIDSEIAVALISRKISR